MTKSMKAKSMKVTMKAKSMKAKKSGMKSMKKSSSGAKKRSMKKVSTIGKGKWRKVHVFRGTKVKTSGGLKKSDLVKNKYGRVVSKKMSQRAKSGALSKWTAAVVAARKALKIKGFCAVGSSKHPKGKALLAKARSIYKPKKK